ncbi:hypothetical protein NHJ13051_001754 [Beauveria bassiana]|uniref:Uncharacterized protein n=1 Tax=Beauveria bassiana TaxID=176275 RepID=A0A2N6NC16_BEABA|nr:hypothetical protein BM221_009631 [Beauveria bassiana]
MPATIVARIAARRAATFSTSARAMKPSAESGVDMGRSSGSSWAWRNLSPKTRQYVKMGAATCVATDAFVLYNYPDWVGVKKASA